MAQRKWKWNSDSSSSSEAAVKTITLSTGKRVGTHWSWLRRSGWACLDSCLKGFLVPSEGDTSLLEYDTARNAHVICKLNVAIVSNRLFYWFTFCCFFLLRSLLYFVCLFVFNANEKCICQIDIALRVSNLIRNARVFFLIFVNTQLRSARKLFWSGSINITKSAINHTKTHEKRSVA